MRSMKVQDYMNRYPLKFKRTMPMRKRLRCSYQHSKTGGPVVDEQKAMW